MVGPLVEGWLLGLRAGASCLGSCGPALAPYLMSREATGVRASARAIAEFLAGRLVAYLLVGVPVLLLGQRLRGWSGMPRLGGLLLLVLGVLLLVHGLTRSFPASRACGVLCGSGPRKIPFTAGLALGLLPCQPLLAGAARLLTLGQLGAGLVFLLAFFAATTLWLVPLLAAGRLARSEYWRGLAQVASVFAGIWFVVLGLGQWVQRYWPVGGKGMSGLVMMFAAVVGLGATTDRHVAWFPAQLAGGTRLEAPKAYDRETIFDYMDGKGEIYLTYHMSQVTVAPYKLGEHKADVMIFDMQQPAEAFGIWSNDLDGEKVEFLQNARYNGGLLRGWVGPIFLKVDGEADNAEVKAFAIAMAKELAAKVKPAEPLPPLAAALPFKALALTNPRYFHSEMSLSAIYYVSTQNVLAVDPFGAKPTVEAMFADATLDGKPAKVLLLQYENAAHREQGWTGYTQKVLSLKAAKGGDGSLAEELSKGQWSGALKVDGPGGLPRLVLVFEAASLQACQNGLAALAQAAGPPRETR